MQSSTAREEVTHKRGGDRGFTARLGRLFGSRRFFIAATLGPAGAILFMLTIYPTIMNIIYSLQSYELTKPKERGFVGLSNYVDVLTDPEFLAAAQRTAIYVIAAVGIELVLGLLIAMLLSQNLRGESIFRSLLVLPLAATPVAVGLIWRLMYNPTGGLVNQILHNLGLPLGKWTSSPTTALASVIIVDIWQWTPFVVLILMAGLLALPEEPFESAKIDGANALQSFWHLTIPMLSPLIYTAVLFRLIDSLKTFDIIWVMTGGGPGRSTTTVNLHAFRTGFEFLHMGTAAAMAILMLILAVVVSTALLRRGKVGQ
jgi:multiple sugar transport system permease protein